MRFAVLMTCHDRRRMTLACLRSLFAQGVREDEVFLVDDGSSDGTSDAVAAEFPSVRLLVGDGSLYWAKGMVRAWEAASAADGWLWLNDDVELAGDAIARLRAAAAARSGEVLVGDMVSPVSGAKTYGLREDGVFSGNFVYVPRSAYERVGMLCGAYSHAWADVDYALRLQRAGIAVRSLGTVGRCEGHPIRPELCGRTLSERIRLLSDPKGWSVRDLWLYRRRNFGFFAAVGSCVHMVFHVLRGGR